MADHDVIVIGAGAAGLAATRTLVDRGLSAIALEARDRVGGRAWTDHETFGVPFDRGCAWLHSGDINPWRPIAARLGLTVIEERQIWTSRVGSQWLAQDEDADGDRAIKARFESLASVGASGRDIAASEVPVKGGLWTGLVEAVVTWYTSVDSSQLSTRDVFNICDTDTDFPIVEGYGTLVARYGAELPLSLATPVTRVAWDESWRHGRVGERMLARQCGDCRRAHERPRRRIDSVRSDVAARQVGGHRQRPAWLCRKGDS